MASPPMASPVSARPRRSIMARRARRYEGWGQMPDDNATMPLPAGRGPMGHPVRRKEDERLLTGRGRFSDDFTLPGQAQAAMVRSPHPHARIVAVDKTRARAMPGVLAVLTGVDCAADGLAPINHDPVPKTRYDMKLGAPGG